MKKLLNLILIMMLVLIPVGSYATETGHTKTVQITAKPGYRVTDVIVNGENKGPLTSYTFSDVLSPQVLEIVTEQVGYVVTFNANGGEGTMEDQAFNKRSAKLNANTFTKEGYAFLGWSTTSNGGVEYENQDLCFILEDTTLYAVWGAYGDFNNDGQINIQDTMGITNYIMGREELNKEQADVNKDNLIDMADLYIVSEAMMNRITTLPYTGIIVYNDEGLLQKADASFDYTIVARTHDNNGDLLGYFVNKWGGQYVKVGETITVSGNTELLPVWSCVFEGMGGASTPATYTITFDSNGGEGSMASQVFTEGVGQNLTSNTYYKDGYEFAGWSTTSGGEVEYVNGAVYMPIEDCVLYAVWNVANYTITYNLDGGSVTGNPTSYNINTADITLNNPTKTGYIFNGWIDSAGNSSTTVVIPSGSTGNKTYTASWIQACTISINGTTNRTTIKVDSKSYGAGIHQVPVGSTLSVTASTDYGYLAVNGTTKQSDYQESGASTFSHTMAITTSSISIDVAESTGSYGAMTYRQTYIDINY